MRLRWQTIMVVVLLVGNLLLLHQNVSLKMRPVRKLAPLGEFVVRSHLPEVRVLDTAAAAHSLRRLLSGHSHTLLVFFSPADCPPCLGEAALW